MNDTRDTAAPQPRDGYCDVCGRFVPIDVETHYCVHASPTAPPPTQPEGHEALSDERIDAIFNDNHNPQESPWVNWRRFARAIESALRAQQDTKDGERFAWYFSDEPKGDFLNAFMQGIREHWSLDQWRAAIDAARGADLSADDAGGGRS
jgi:hypothetical protein